MAARSRRRHPWSRRQPNLRPSNCPRESHRGSKPAPRNELDADGIADYRVFMTETFDAEGKLVSVTEEQDFEADGVIDARDTTNFR